MVVKTWLKRNLKNVIAIMLALFFCVGYWFPNYFVAKNLTSEQIAYCEDVAIGVCSNDINYLASLPENVNVLKTGNKIEVSIAKHMGTIVGTIEDNNIKLHYDTELLERILLSFGFGIIFVLAPILIFLLIFLVCCAIEDMMKNRKGRK